MSSSLLENGALIFMEKRDLTLFTKELGHVTMKQFVVICKYNLEGYCISYQCTLFSMYSVHVFAFFRALPQCVPSTTAPP